MRVKDLFASSLLFRFAVYMTVVSVFVVIFSTLYINNVVEESRRKRAMLDSRQNIQLNFEQVLSFYSNEYSILRDSLDTIIPSTDDIVILLENIERSSINMGLDPEIKNIEVDTNESEVKFVRYLISFDGNKDQLLKFIDMLMNLKVYTEVQSINSIQIDEFDFNQLSKHEVVFDIFIRNND